MRPRPIASATLTALILTALLLLVAGPGLASPKRKPAPHPVPPVTPTSPTTPGASGEVRKALPVGEDEEITPADVSAVVPMYAPFCGPPKPPCCGNPC